MKISPLAGGSGTPGTSLGAVEIGRTADASKMQRAKAIAAGETVQPEEKEVIPQVERVSTKRIQMRTNYSTDRDLEVANAAAQLTNSSENVNKDPANNTQSSTTPNSEQGAVEATQPLSPQLAAIARQKRALQLERAEFEKQKAELSKSNGIDPEQFKARLQADPLGVLQEHGVTYDRLTESILSGQADPKVQALEQRIKELESGLDKKLTDRDNAAEQAALSEMKREAQTLASTGDDFELIRATNSVPLVMTLIERTYRSTGEVLDVSEAMREVEAELVKDAEKLMGAKKFAGKFQPQQQTQAAAPQRQLKTLTSSGNTQAPLTARQRALMAFHGTLKG